MAYVFNPLFLKRLAVLGLFLIGCSHGVLVTHAANDSEEIARYEKRLQGQSREIEAQNIRKRLTPSEYKILRQRWQTIQGKLRTAKADGSLTAGERLDLNNAMNALALRIKEKALNTKRPVH
ncbi:MAG: hypothetical protein ACKO37_01470 [Vampirovibrionales bacterium]